MSWYETQFKNLQVARQRNKQEERRLQLVLDRKHGLRAIHEWRLEEVNKEQRLVERELERIRMGIHKVPLPGEIFGPLGRRHSKRRSRFSGGQEIFVSDSKNLADNLSPQLNKDNVFLKAIMYVENGDMDPLEKAAKDHIEQSDCANALAIGVDSSSVPYRDLALSPRGDDTQKPTFADDSTPNRNIDVRESETNVVEFVPEPSLDLSYVKQNSSKSSAAKNNSAGNLVTTSPRSQPRALAGSKVKERQTGGFSLDLVSLASLDMKSVKSDVARRISQQKAANQQTTGKRGSVTDTSSAASQSGIGETKARERSAAAIDDAAAEKPTTDVMDDVDAKSPDSAKPKEKSDKTRRISKPNQPKEIDPSDYNPDGSLKKMYMMPKFEDSWKEAQRARYIRHGKNSDILERERELSVKEVFDKESKTKDPKY